MVSFNDSNGSYDSSLLLQNLIERLQLRPSYLNTNSYLSQSLEDFLLDENENEEEEEQGEGDERTLLAKEESKLEKEIIRTIIARNFETLKPNSGQAVTIGEHHICVGFHQQKDSDYRVWEWHGHIMLFDDENGYTPEYIYGNYFERVLVNPSPSPPVVAPQEEEEEEEEKEKEKEEEEEKAGNLGGLKELIDGGESISGCRILRRNLNADSSKF